MKLQGSDVSNTRTWEDLRRFVAQNFKNALTVINGNLAFGDNIQGTTPIAFSVTSANQVIQVSFDLPYVPSNFVVTYLDANAVVFAANASRYPWTAKTAFITASAAVKGKIIIF